MERPTNPRKNSRNLTGKATSVLVLIALSTLAIFALNWPLGDKSSPATHEENVSTANSCGGPLVLAHGFSVYQTNQEKTGFVALDIKAAGELRSFSWSQDGQELALVGNTTGSGAVYVADSALNKFYLVP
jgi:hypothetical protein